MYKRVLLVNAPLYDYHQRVMLPLGISYLASSLKNAGFCCDVFDGNLEQDGIDQIVQRALNYEFVGISSNSFSFGNALKIAQGIKKKSTIPVVYGGHHATFEHEAIINEYTCFDAIIRGEGETAIVELCTEFFDFGHFITPVYGVTYRNLNGQIVLADTIRYEVDLDRLPFPFRGNQERYAQYQYGVKDKRNYVSVCTSRGCPYGCSFCSVTSFRKQWSARSAKNVACEVLELYKQFGELFLIFIDDNFYMDPKRSIEILKEIRNYCGRDFEFSFCTRADQIIRNGDDYLRILKDYGCHNIEIGIENGSNSVFNRYCKNTTVEDNIAALKKLRSIGIKAAVDYILFDPKTTVEELKENVRFFKSSKLWGYYMPLLYNCVKPLPGTNFHNKYRGARLDSYFENTEVSQIYLCMQKFKRTYQLRICNLIDKWDEQYDVSGEVLFSKERYLSLRTLPYRLLEELVENYSDVANTYLKFEMKTNLNVWLSDLEVVI